MLHLLLSYYAAGVSLPVILLPLLFALLALPIGAWLLGPSGSRSTRGGLSPRQRRVTWTVLIVAWLVGSHLALALLARNAFRRGPLTSDDLLTKILIGPAGYYDVTWMITQTGLALGAGLLLAAGAYILIADGGPLRTWINQLRDPSRQRGEVGSAVFCQPANFARLQKQKPDGLTLVGAFWGKGRGEKTHRFQRLDAGPLRQQVPGICLSVEDQARGMVVIGPPATGKSQACILPVAADTMALGHSLIMVDPQGELTPHVLEYAAVTGHQVIIHDPTDATQPHYNLAHNITNIKEAQAIAQVLVMQGHGNDPSDSKNFWQSSARNLLAACLMRYGNLGEILLALSDQHAMAERLSAKQDDATFLASSFINAAYSPKGDVAGSTVSTLQASTLSAWADGTVRQATTNSDFSAKMLIKEPSVLLLKCPGRYKKVFGPYLGAILQRMMLDLDTIGEEIGGALPRPVKIILDEFPLLGRLDAVVEAVNTFRKRHISILIAAQTLAQFDMIYGRSGAEALITGLATQIIFGACDPETASYVSRTLGKSTEQRPGKQPGEPPSTYQRDLMTIDEVITPPQPESNCTVIHRTATASYATQVVMLAQLARMYDRADWQQKTQDGKRKGRVPLILAAAPVFDRPEQPVRSPAPRPTTSAAPGTFTPPVASQPTLKVVVPEEEKTNRYSDIMGIETSDKSN